MHSVIWFTYFVLSSLTNQLFSLKGFKTMRPTKNWTPITLKCLEEKINLQPIPIFKSLRTFILILRTSFCACQKILQKPIRNLIQNIRVKLTIAAVTKVGVGKLLTLANKQNKTSKEQRDSINRCMLSLSGLSAPF